MLGLASTTALVLSVPGDGNTTFAYYATHTRAAELLAGVFLACTVHNLAQWRWRPYVVPVLGVIAAGGLVFFWVWADQASPALYRGGITAYTLASVGVIIAVAPTRAGAHACSSCRPSSGSAASPTARTCTTGRCSSGSPRSASASGVRRSSSVRVAMTIGVATLSAAVLEVPIRKRQLVPRMSLGPACFVAISALLVMLAVPTQATDTGPSGVEVAIGQRVIAPDGPPETEASTSTSTPPTSDGSTTVTTSIPPRDRMDRLLLVGDSITKQIAPYYAERYPAVDVRWVGADGIGPLTAQGRIADLVQEEVAEFDPDVVLFEFAGSYTKKRGGEPFRLSDGTEVEDGTELMFEVWADQSQLLVREARAKGATVLWALAPPVDPDGYFKYLAPNIDRFNEIYKNLSSVVLVDWFTAAGGQYTPQLAVSGREEVARSGDGLHFTAFGYRHLVEASEEAIASYRGRTDVNVGTRGRASD